MQLPQIAPHQNFPDGSRTRLVSLASFVNGAPVERDVSLDVIFNPPV